MKEKKEKGNVLLLLLVIGMVIAILGSTLSTATAYTGKNNFRNKNIEDLICVAEAGIEYGISKLRADGITGITISNIDTINIQNTLFGIVNELKVIINNEDGNGHIKIESIAKNSEGIEKKVSTKVKKTPGTSGGTGNIFNNGLVATKGNIDITGKGTVTLSTTNINSSLPPNYAITGSPVYPPNTTNDMYADLIFDRNFKNKSSVTVNSIAQLGTSFIDEDGNNIPSEDLTYYALSNSTLQTNEINGVGYIDYIRESGDLKSSYKVYLINADELNILYPMNYTDAVDKTIVICSGKINLIPMPSTHESFLLNCVNSLLYGQAIKIKEDGAIFMAYMPIDDARDSGRRNGYELTNTQLKELNKDIKLFIPNWNTETGGGSSGSSDDSYNFIGDEYEIE